MQETVSSGALQTLTFPACCLAVTGVPGIYCLSLFSVSGIIHFICTIATGDFALVRRMLYFTGIFAVGRGDWLLSFQGAVLRVNWCCVCF